MFRSLLLDNKLINNPFKVLGLFFLLFAFLPSHGQLSVSFLTPNGYQKPDGSGVVVCNPDQINFNSTSSYDGNPIVPGDADYRYTWVFSHIGNPVTLVSPAIAYTSTGFFSVTLTIEKISTGESASFTRSNYIEVVDKPNIDFSFAPTTGCVPMNVCMSLAPSFSVSGDPNLAQFSWLILTEGGSTQREPCIPVSSPGKKTITLEVVDEYGCRSEKTLNDTITAKEKPDPEFAADINFVCDPDLNFTLTAAETGDFDFLWTIDGQGTSTGNTASGTYTTPGEYSVTLDISGGVGCDTTLTKAAYLVVDDMTIDFAIPDTVCPGDGVSATFTGSNADTYSWNFGDGGSSNDENPGFTPSGLGPRTVTLTITSNNGACTKSLSKELVVEQVEADFTIDAPNSCKIPHTASFDASISTFPPNSTFTWNTNGATYFGLNASHTYTAFGNYNVRLTITTPNGCEVTERKVVRIRPITLDAEIEEIEGCVDLANEYRDVTNYTGFTVTSRTWTTFLNGTEVDAGGSAGNTVYNYTATEHGVYSVILDITTAEGCNSSTSFGFVAGLKPTAAFDVRPRDTCASEDTEFIDLSYVELPGGVQDPSLIDEWEWNHEEGPTNEQNPKIKYRRFGNDTLNGDLGRYDLELIVGYHGCYDTLLKPDYFNKWGPVINSLRQFRPCGSDTIYVYGDMFAWTSRQWSYFSFDIDGNRTDTVYDLELFPSFEDTVFNGLPVNSGVHSQSVATSDTLKIYAPNGFRGEVTVQLWNNAYASCDSCLYEVSLDIDDLILYSFDMDESACLVEPINNPDNEIIEVPLIPQGVSGAFRWVVIHPDSSETIEGTNTSINFQPDSAGIYSVCLETKFNSACPERFCRQIEFQVPEVEVILQDGNFVGCADLLVDLFGNPTGSPITSWNWEVLNVEDPANPILIQTYSGQDPPPHTFEDDGDYLFRLEAVDNLGCETAADFGEEIIVTNPDVAFTIDQVGYCFGDSLRLTNLSTFEEGLRFRWYLNDSLISTDSIPKVEVLQVDTFDIKLVAETDECIDSLIIENAISVDPVPSFDFDASITYSSCPPLNTLFSVDVDDEGFEGYTYEWDFEGFGTAVEDTGSINFRYSAPGSYGVSLTVKTPNECNVTLDKPNFIEVEGPFADDITVSDNNVCVNEEITFTVNGAINTEYYVWNYGDGISDTVDVQPLSNTITHAFSTGSAIPYTVTLFLVNEDCKPSFTIDVNVNELTALIDPLPTDTFCGPPQTVTFNSVSTGAVSSTQWKFDNGPFQASPTNTYNTAGEYQVTLEVFDQASQCIDTEDYTIWIFDLPNVTAPNDIILCEGEVQDLQATGDVNVIYDWSPKNSLTNLSATTDSSLQQVNPIATETYTIVGIDTLTLCENQDVVLVERDETEVGFSLNYPDSCGSETINIQYPTDYVGANTNWTVSNPSGVIDQFSTAISSFNATQADSFFFTLVDYDLDARCAQTVKDTVVIYPLPIPTLIPDDVICLGESIELTSAGGDSVRWEVLNPPGAIVPENHNPIVSPSDNTTYRMTVVNRIPDCESSQDITIYVDKALALAEINRLDSCGFGQVAFSDLGSIGIYFSMDWGDGQEDISPNIPTSKTYANPGVYEQVFIARDNPLNDTHCEDTLRWTFEVYPLPIALANTADDLICNYEAVQLSGDGGLIYDWTPGKTLSDSTVSNPFAAPDTTTEYHLLVTDINNCQDDTTVRVEVVPEYVVDPKQPNDTINIGEFVQVYFDIVDSINASPYNVTIDWLERYAMECDDCNSTQGQPLRTTTYQIYTIDPHNCYPKTFDFEVFVKEQYQMDIPTAFSPNGDETNDVIYVRGLGIKELLYFKIFNRFGELVYDGTEISEGWNGFYKDQIQNDETYVFQAAVLYYNNEIEKREGYISILK